MGTYEMAVIVLLTGAAWWVAASIAVSQAAHKWGRLRGPWLFLSLFLGPVFAVLVLMAYPLEDVKGEDAGAV